MIYYIILFEKMYGLENRPERIKRTAQRSKYCIFRLLNMILTWQMPHR